jgi:hypothetical protein
MAVGHPEGWRDGSVPVADASAIARRYIGPSAWLPGDTPDPPAWLGPI